MAIVCYKGWRFDINVIYIALSSVSKDDHSDVDCLLVAVMTHGDKGEIYGTDGPMNASEITTPFRGDHCQGLIGKPKLFIFQVI